MDLFRLRTRNRTFVANHQIIPNPTLSLLVQCLSHAVPRNPGIRCLTSTGSVIEFRWHFSHLAFQMSCSFTHMQLAAYSNVGTAPISEGIPGKMLKHGAFLLTAELGTTPTCKQSIRQSMLEHYTWHFFGTKTMHLISYAVLFSMSRLGLCYISQDQKGVRDEISLRDEVLCFCELEYF